MSAEADLGAIVRARQGHFLATRRLTREQRKAMRAIAACRTPSMGGHRYACDHCGYEHVQWNSCRNRVCPLCQSSARHAWLEDRRAELLPVPYFHVVFTVPDALNPIALYAPAIFYDLLLRAAGSTLIDIGQSRLHARLGALCVLHTWGQTLTLHPHVHCVVPGGGFSIHHGRWCNVRKASFFLPVKVLARRFRTRLCAALQQAWQAGDLALVPSALVADTVAFDLLLARACSKDWVVYCKPPFGGPEQVLAYLANYTHRIAISNSRIMAFDGRSVTFRYRDYADGNTRKTMTLDADEFLRRFLLHVLPNRFVRIRYYGFLANRGRLANIAHAREQITERPFVLPLAQPVPGQVRCPHCSEGIMRLAGAVAPQPAPFVAYEDSS